MRKKEKLTNTAISGLTLHIKEKDLERYLESLKKPFNMFWVTEYTNHNYNTHNHLLVKGNIVGDINYHLKSKSLIGDHVKHLPYEKSASMYVSKFI